MRTLEGEGVGDVLGELLGEPPLPPQAATAETSAAERARRIIVCETQAKPPAATQQSFGIDQESHYPSIPSGKAELVQASIRKPPLRVGGPRAVISPSRGGLAP